MGVWVGVVSVQKELGAWYYGTKQNLMMSLNTMVSWQYHGRIEHGGILNSMFIILSFRLL